MKIVDANVLLYAANIDLRQHQAAANWLTSALRTEAVGFPWVSLLAFLRISTNPRAFPTPMQPEQALDLMEVWLSPANAVIVEPTSRHPSILRGLIEQAGTAGNLTTDAHIAALAVEHGAEVVSFDRDFERFGVRLHLLR